METTKEIKEFKEKKAIVKRDSDMMGTEPVHKLLIKMSFPLMLSMLVMSLYNIVDSIFVSRINEEALTAISLVFPFQNLNLAFGIGTAVGMSALLSKNLGARQYEKAEKVAHNGFILVGINYLLFFAIGCFAEPIIKAQTSDPLIVQYGTDYLRITQWLSIALLMQAMLERLLQATGKTKYILYVQISGALFNLVMDPIFIFGWFGIPAMGVKGAAIATVFGQILACILGVVFNISKNRELELALSKIKPHKKTILDIYKIAIPVIVLQSVGSLMIFSLNKILIGISATAVATFGAYFKLQSFVFMPVFGLNTGSVPIMAFNYGAGNRYRLEEAMSLCVKYGVGLMTVGTILFWIFPAEMMSLFDASPTMVDIGTVTLRVISLGYPLAGYNIMRGSAYQALGRSVYSMNISLVRQLVVLIPAAFVFAQIAGVDMVWWAFPLAEISGTVMSILYTRRIRRKIIEKMQLISM